MAPAARTGKNIDAGTRYHFRFICCGGFYPYLLVLTVAAHRRLLRSWFTGTVPDESRKIPTPDPPEKEPGGISLNSTGLLP